MIRLLCIFVSVFYIFSIPLIMGCKEDHFVGSVTSGAKEYNRICIDGVEYLKTGTGRMGFFAPHFRQDGSLYLCNGERR